MNNISIGKYISSIYRHQSIVINAKIKDLGLSSGQYLFLLRIGNYPGVTQKELSELIHIDRANTNRAVKRLESQSLIYTESDEVDRRNKRNYLTPEGEKTRMLLLNRLQELTAILGKGIDETELLQFVKTIEKIEQNIQTAVTHLREDNHDN